MARVTVEDCVEKVGDRFELVILAAERAKRIHSGSMIMVKRDNDKDAVIALREIARGLLDIDKLRNDVLKRLQTRVSVKNTDDLENEFELQRNSFEEQEDLFIQIPENFDDATANLEFDNFSNANTFEDATDEEMDDFIDK